MKGNRRGENTPLAEDIFHLGWIGSRRERHEQRRKSWKFALDAEAKSHSLEKQELHWNFVNVCQSFHLPCLFQHEMPFRLCSFGKVVKLKSPHGTTHLELGLGTAGFFSPAPSFELGILTGLAIDGGFEVVE